MQLQTMNIRYRGHHLINIHRVMSSNQPMKSCTHRSAMGTELGNATSVGSRAGRDEIVFEGFEFDELIGSPGADDLGGM